MILTTEEDSAAKPISKIMIASYNDFLVQWRAQEGIASSLIEEVAWRRYQHVQSPDYVKKSESDEPTLDDLRIALQPLLSHSIVANQISQYRFLTLTADTIPWTPTGIYVEEDRPVSVFATGRTWRSRLLDLYLPPQFNLWYRIGVNGLIFNSTKDTRTFKCIGGQAGELFVANQFPGQFGEREGGRLTSGLSVYEKAQGAFQICLVEWQDGMSIREDVKNAWSDLLELSFVLAAGEQKQKGDPYGLLSMGVKRLTDDYFLNHFPRGWKLLWFLGMSEVFSQHTEEEIQELEKTEGKRSDRSENAQPIAQLGDEMKLTSASEEPEASLKLAKTSSKKSPSIIRCLPDRNVGILQQDIECFPLYPSTLATWKWNFKSLPSRLREDTTLTHDYLSLAFEFENGRDLTYTWSWELPVDYGYWCPIGSWCDREYHIVIRSGTKLLGEWLDESRNIHEDYIKYVNAGDLTKAIPRSIVRTWLIAGNRWQRYRGEMLIKNIVLQYSSDNGIERAVIL